MEIIAFVGPIGAGKTTLAKYTKELWLDSQMMTISRFIRQELEQLGIEPTRQAHSNLVIQRRQETFPEYWIDLVVAEARTLKIERLIIDGVRTPCDARYLIARGAILLGVNAPKEIRFKRVRERGRPGEPVSDEDLDKMLEDDYLSGGKYGFDIAACLTLCHNRLDGSKSEIENALKLLLWLEDHGFELEETSKQLCLVHYWQLFQ